MKLAHIDIGALKKELLVAFRGNRSQLQLSRSLGFDYNQIYRWESGSRRLYWSDFVKLCKTCGIDLKAAFNLRHFDGDINMSDQVVKHLVGQKKLLKISQEFDLSPHILRTWIKGEGEIHLSPFLKILMKMDILLPFAGKLIDIKKIPSLQETFLEREAQNGLAYDEPFLGPLMMCLDLDSYKNTSSHVEGFLGGLLGISKEKEKELLDKAQKVNIVSIVKGKYVNALRVYNTSQDPQKEKKLQQFWFKKGLDAYNHTRSAREAKPLFGNVAMALSTDAYDSLREAYIEFANQIRLIATNDKQPKALIRILNIQLFDPAATELSNFTKKPD